VRHRVLQLLFVLVPAYLILVGYVMVRESSFVYFPDERAVPEPPTSLALRHEDVAFSASDGTGLTGWIVRATDDSSGIWLLVCHGNYGNIGAGGRPEFYASARDAGLNVFAFDYRGYGKSEGKPSEAGLYDDAQSAYGFLRDAVGVPAGRIVLFGQSLGSGVAIELATRVPAAGVIVEAAYTSVVDRGQELYPFLPVRWIAKNRFASIDKVARVAMPKLFLHSADDELIPIAHGRRLFAAASEPKRFVQVRGAHMEAAYTDRDVYFGAVRDFVRATGVAFVDAGAAPRR